MPEHVGFVSTRFAGTDGVSLESAKWAEVLWEDENDSFWYGGRLDRGPTSVSAFQRPIFTTRKTTGSMTSSGATIAAPPRSVPGYGTCRNT